MTLQTQTTVPKKKLENIQRNQELYKDSSTLEVTSMAINSIKTQFKDLINAQNEMQQTKKIEDTSRSYLGMEKLLTKG